MDDYFYENFNNIKNNLKKGLEDFDKDWVSYENVYFIYIFLYYFQKYIYELIDIENKSRRFVTYAIESDKNLKIFEDRAKNRGQIILDSEEFNNQRKTLVNLIVQINKVANINGKGRDDLTLDILLSAEGILRRITSNQSRSARFLAEKVKQSFMQMRMLLRKYDENIEIVDPQLKNNPELVDSLYIFESTWEKGKEYLLNKSKCSQLIFFSQLMDILCEKYKEISEQVETRDPNMFVWIPSIIVLKSIENDDHGICMEYNPNMYDSSTDCGRLYNELKVLSTKLGKTTEDKYLFYNCLERLLLFETNEFDNFQKGLPMEFLNKIKILAMNLQRIKASDWNNFVDLAMNGVE